MTRQQLFDQISKDLLPIIVKDEDIIDCVDKNDFSKEEREWFLMWLLNASISVLLDGSDEAVYKELVQSCDHDMKYYEKKLAANYGDDVSHVLIEILKDNIDEWAEIISQNTKGSQGGSSKGSGKKVSSPEDAVLKLHIFFLKKVIEDSSDFDNFADDYSQIDKSALSMFVALNVFYAFLHEIKQGKVRISREWPGYKLVDKMIPLAQQYMGGICEEEFKEFDPEQFNQDMTNLVNDNYKDYIEGMFDALAENE